MTPAPAPLPEAALPPRGGGRRLPKSWTDRFESGSLEEARHCRYLAALAMEGFGDWILPLFERLDEEVARLERQESALERARAIARTRS